MVLLGNRVGAGVEGGTIPGQLVRPVVAGTLPVGDSGALNIGPRGVAFVPLDSYLLHPPEIVDAIPEEAPKVGVSVAAGASDAVSGCVAVRHELAVGENFQRGEPPDEHLVYCVKLGPWDFLDRARKGPAAGGFDPPLADGKDLAEAPATACEQRSLDMEATPIRAYFV